MEPGTAVHVIGKPAALNKHPPMPNPRNALHIDEMQQITIGADVSPYRVWIIWITRKRDGGMWNYFFEDCVMFIYH